MAHSPSGKIRGRNKKKGQRIKQQWSSSIAFMWIEAKLGRREIESRVSNCITDHIYIALRVPFGLRGEGGMDKGSPVNDIKAPESQSQRRI